MQRSISLVFVLSLFVLSACTKAQPTLEELKSMLAPKFNGQENWEYVVNTPSSAVSFDGECDARVSLLEVSFDNLTWIDVATLAGSSVNCSTTGTFHFEVADISVYFPGLTIGDSKDVYLKASSAGGVTGQSKFKVKYESPPIPALAVNDVTASESDTSITFTVSLNVVATTDITFDWSTSTLAGTGYAADGADFSGAANTATITAGNLSTTITLTLLPDTLDEEDNEVFYFDISNASANSVISDNRGIGTISDDDLPPEISIANVSITEGGTATFSATLSQASERTIEVDFATASGTATSGTDFTANSGTLIFSAGQTSKSISVSTASEVLYEENETFDVGLSNFVNVSAGANITATGTITNDDAMPTVNFQSSTSSYDEDSGAVEVTIELDALSGMSTTVAFTVNAGSTATGGGTDYSFSPASSVTIAAGSLSAKITVNLVDDSNYEGNETIIFEIGAITNATVGATTSHTLTVNDNDPNLVLSPPTLSFGNVYLGSSKTLTITLMNSGAGTATGIIPSGIFAPMSFNDLIYPGLGGTCGTSLGAGSSCSIALTFEPISTVSTSRTLTLSYNGTAATATISGTGQDLTVSSLYPINGANWNDYVKFDNAPVGSNEFDQDDVACDGSETGLYGRLNGCIHGGEKRKVALSAPYNSCNLLFAKDQIDAFDWSCVLEGGIATLVSKGLKAGKGLRDLMNNGASFKLNSVTVQSTSNTDRNIPIASDIGQSYSKVSSGTSYSCGITDSNKLKCWGDNSNSKLGNDSTVVQPYPLLIDEVNDYTHVSTNFSFTCGLRADSNVFCWGRNNYGQLGDGTTTSNKKPTNPAGAGFNFIAKSPGEHVCGIKSGNDLYCWGYNNRGQVGTNYPTSATVPQLIGSYTQVATGYQHTCGIQASGEMNCWGDNTYRQIGSVNASLYFGTPEPVTGGLYFNKVAAGAFHTCGIATSGRVYCWGMNTAGQLGDGTATNKTVPTLTTDTDIYIELSAGNSHTCGITQANALKCWGDNTYGQLGDGTNTQSQNPKVINSGRQYKTVSAGYRHTCAITMDNQLRCWGNNNLHQLGEVFVVGKSLESDSWWTNGFAPFPTTTSTPVELTSTGSIYYTTTNINTDGYTIAGEKISIVTLGSSEILNKTTGSTNNYNASNCSTASPTFKSIFCMLSGKNFNWIEAKIRANTSNQAHRAITIVGSRYNRINNSSFGPLNTTGSANFAANLGTLANSKITNLRIFKSLGGLSLDPSGSQNIFENLDIAHTTASGAPLLNVMGNNNYFYDTTLSNAVMGTTYGLYLYGSYNVFQRLNVSNIGGSSSNAIMLANSASNNIFVQALSNNSINAGISFNGSGDVSNNIISHFSANSHIWQGVFMTGNVNNNTFNSIALTNTTNDGILFVSPGSSSGNVFNNTAISNTTRVASIQSTGSTNTTFTGYLIMPSNTAGNLQCSTYWDGAFDDADCNSITANEIAAGFDVAYSYFGNVTNANGADATTGDGTGAYSFMTATGGEVYWFGLDNFFRSWGFSTSVFPSVSNIGACTTATCQLFDWRVKAGSLLHNKSFDGINLNTKPNTDMSACSSAHLAPAQVLTASGYTFLKYAIEIDKDDIGNDNGLCEAGESCLNATNIGAYQGEGKIVNGYCTVATAPAIKIYQYEFTGTQ